MSEEQMFPSSFMTEGMSPIELNVVLETAVDTDDALARTKWRITSVGSANWAMARLVEAEAGLDDVRELADAWRERVDQWEMDATKEERATVEFMRAQLARWAVEQREAGGKATIPLMGGKVKTQDRKATAEIMDQDAVVAWAKASGHQELVQTKETVLVSKLREVAQVREVTHESHALLACGHDTLVKGVTAPGEMIACSSSSVCPACQAPDGDIMQPVVEVTSEIVESVVLPMVTDKPEPIPGTRVNPRRIIPSIVLD